MMGFVKLVFDAVLDHQQLRDKQKKCHANSNSGSVDFHSCQQHN